MLVDDGSSLFGNKFVHHSSFFILKMYTVFTYKTRIKVFIFKSGLTIFYNKS